MTGKHQIKDMRVGRECRNDLHTPTDGVADIRLDIK